MDLLTHAVHAIGPVALALDARLRTATWLLGSEQHRIRHPLSGMDLALAGVNTQEKPLDALVYHLSALALHWSPAARRMWIECESELLLFKLLLRPQLHHTISRILGRDPRTSTLETAAQGIEAVHEHNLEIILSSPDMACELKEAPLLQLASAYLRKLAYWDTCREEELRSQGQSAPNGHAVTTHAGWSQSYGSLVSCAPACMSKLLAAATGSMPQQAAVPDYHRRYASLYLMKAGWKSDAILRLMRPKVVIEYEAESPKQSWAEIQFSIRSTSGMYERSRKPSAALQTDAEYAGQSCQVVIDAGLCPMAGPGPCHPLASHRAKSHKLTPYQRFQAAKKKCHAQLQLAADREHEALTQQPAQKKHKGMTSCSRIEQTATPAAAAARRTTGVPPVPREWAHTPWMFTQQMARIKGMTSRR